MLYSFARVSAVLGMRRQDYFGQGSPGRLRLHEKGGKRHDVPAHHRAAATLDAYVEAGGASADGPGARAAARPGDDQAAGCGRGAAALDVLSHVPGNGHHGLPVEQGDARARAADRAHRDLNSAKDHIETGSLAGLRDRARLSVMLYKLRAGERGSGRRRPSTSTPTR